MRIGRGTSWDAPLRADCRGRAAVGPLVAGLLVMAVAACSPASYDVPWQVNGPAQSAPGAVVVQQGDSIYGLSRRYGVPVRAIIEANALEPPYILYAGQRLILPLSRVHVVQRGDTLSQIARAYGVDMHAMARINRLGPPYVIQVGQRLQVPSVDNSAPAPVQTAAGSPSRSHVVLPTQKPTPLARDIERQSRPSTVGAYTPPPPPRATPPAPPARAAGTFAWPVTGEVISTFGPKGNGTRNDGINIRAPRGTPVRAAENGVVVYAGNELRGFGNLLLLKHEGGLMTAYAHTELFTVSRGDTVQRGQIIARVGSTGNVTEPQLHFEIRRGSRAVDPMPLLTRQMAER